MNLSVFSPVLAGETASCRVSGNFEHGYIKVKVNGAYHTVHPDDHPGIPTDHRNVLTVPPGASYDVWTSPSWSSGDTLTFELYASATNALAAAPVSTVVP
jgi:hypothetical protein